MGSTVFIILRNNEYALVDKNVARRSFINYQENSIFFPSSSKF